ncbi:O-antigen ligase family protein [Anoxybacillus kestanbolensis]|uniref:O-antigen ligase family protein n=1 Tax=Anoxybacillus kestanbolensis TaxID=227476 RepID=UPI0011785B39|nr:O-antigen ligase family protein [Anoxybacillus kestanbolensis]
MSTLIYLLLFYDSLPYPISRSVILVLVSLIAIAINYNKKVFYGTFTNMYLLFLFILVFASLFSSFDIYNFYGYRKIYYFITIVVFPLIAMYVFGYTIDKDFKWTSVLIIIGVALTVIKYSILTNFQLVGLRGYALLKGLDVVIPSKNVGLGIIVCIICLLIYKLGMLGKVFTFFSLILFIVYMLYLEGRATILITTFCVIFVYIFNTLGVKKVNLIVVTSMLIGGIYLILNNIEFSEYRYSNFFQDESRVALYKKSLEIIKENFLVGKGIGQFDDSHEDLTSYPHNIIMEIFVELGIFITFFFIFIIFIFLFKAFTLKKYKVPIFIITLYFLLHAQFSGDIVVNSPFFVFLGITFKELDFQYKGKIL